MKKKYAYRMPPAYARSILEVMNRKEQVIRPEETCEIEEVMRVAHPTLDHLDRRAFGVLVKRSWKVVQELRATYDDHEWSVPFEPARGDGIIPNWVMSREQFESLPGSVKRRWCWEHIGGISTGRKRTDLGDI